MSIGESWRDLSPESMGSARLLMTRVEDRFTDLLERRLAAGVFTTEDSFRYTLFAALLQLRVEPDQVVLESRYKAIERAKLDMLLVNTNRLPIVAIEFKYDRAIPGGMNLPLPQKAGKLFADIDRLLFWHDDVLRYFVYLSGPEMLRYLTAQRRTLTRLFSLDRGSEFHLAADAFAQESVTFQTASGKRTAPIDLRVAVSIDLPEDHHLWIFEVTPTELPQPKQPETKSSPEEISGLEVHPPSVSGSAVVEVSIPNIPQALPEPILGTTSDIRIADEVWIATALLHKQCPDRTAFSTKEILDRVRETALYP